MRQSFKILSALFIFSSILTGCIENHDIDNFYLPECPGGHPNDTTTQNKNKIEVGFSAAVNQLMTKAGTSPLQANRNVSVYTFYGKGDYISTTSYFTNTPGELTPARNIPLSLFPGSYEFYALSIGNKTMKLPQVDLSTGFVDNLSNGIDYLSCVLPNITITSATSVPLTFNHVCSQLMVTIRSGNTTTIIDSIASATIQQPITTSTFLSIYTGGIPQTGTLASTPLEMNIVDSLCNQILLPIKNIDSLTMNFSVFANGQSTPQPYTVKIPLVNSAMLKGTSYSYQINLQKEKVVISPATVNNWTEVNETGKPLTPIPN